MRYSIGIDIGGTNMKFGIADENGKIFNSTNVATKARDGNAIFVKQIIQGISQLINKDVVGIGIGFPGNVDIKDGTLIKAANIRVKNIPIQKILEKKFKVKVFVDNDANCWALAESRFGNGKTRKDMVMLTLGTGLGSGIIIDNKILHGKTKAGEIGHTTIKFDGLRCSCGKLGCLEEYVSKRAVLRYAQGLEVQTPLDVFSLASQGDKQAKKAFEELGFYLGIGISNIINTLDPEVIIIGGNISKAWKFFHKQMSKTVCENLLYVKPCPIILAKLGESAGVLGAAALVFQ